MRSQQCAPLKHHYEECSERVQHQQSTTGKAHEDCVEECKLAHAASLHLETGLLTQPYSLPPDALRQPVRRAEAVQAATVDDKDVSPGSSSTPAGLPRDRNWMASNGPTGQRHPVIDMSWTNQHQTDRNPHVQQPRYIVLLFVTLKIRTH